MAVQEPHEPRTTGVPDPPQALQLLAEEAILQLPGTDQLLMDSARAAAAGVGLSCGITYLAGYGMITVASSDARANAVDEIQYGADLGPCLDALRTTTVIRVDDLATEMRWGNYRDLALQAGVRSSLSMPLVTGRSTVGALNVYSTDVGPLPADQEAAAIVAVNQVTGILATVRRLAAGLLSNPDSARRFQEYHELNIAIGVVMSEHGCTAEQALALLEADAQDEGLTIGRVVARTLRVGRPPRGPAS